MYLLGLDIGTKRTGVAFADDESGFVVALNTIKHRSTAELIAELKHLIREKGITKLIVGLPRLPQGQEGAQAEKVRSVIDALGTATGLEVEVLDERYSTPKEGHQTDRDAEAACALLSVYLERCDHPPSK